MLNRSGNSSPALNHSKSDFLIKKPTQGDPGFILEESAELEGLTDFLRNTNNIALTDTFLEREFNQSIGLPVSHILNLADVSGKIVYRKPSGKPEITIQESTSRTSTPCPKSPGAKYPIPIPNLQKNNSENNKHEGAILSQSEQEKGSPSKGQYNGDQKINNKQDANKGKILMSRIPNSIKQKALFAMESVPKIVRTASQSDKKESNNTQQTGSISKEQRGASLGLESVKEKEAIQSATSHSKNVKGGHIQKTGFEKGMARVSSMPNTELPTQNPEKALPKDRSQGILSSLEAGKILPQALNRLNKGGQLGHKAPNFFDAAKRSLQSARDLPESLSARSRKLEILTASSLEAKNKSSAVNENINKNIDLNRSLSPSQRAKLEELRMLMERIDSEPGVMNQGIKHLHMPKQGMNKETSRENLIETEIPSKDILKEFRSMDAKSAALALIALNRSMIKQNTARDEPESPNSQTMRKVEKRNSVQEEEMIVSKENIKLFKSQAPQIQVGDWKKEEYIDREEPKSLEKIKSVSVVEEKLKESQEKDQEILKKIEKVDINPSSEIVNVKQTKEVKEVKVEEVIQESNIKDKKRAEKKEKDNPKNREKVEKNKISKEEFQESERNIVQEQHKQQEEHKEAQKIQRSTQDFQKQDVIVEEKGRDKNKAIKIDKKENTHLRRIIKILKKSDDENLIVLKGLLETTDIQSLKEAVDAKSKKEEPAGADHQVEYYQLKVNDLEQQLIKTQEKIANLQASLDSLTAFQGSKDTLPLPKRMNYDDVLLETPDFYRDGNKANLDNIINKQKQISYGTQAIDIPDKQEAWKNNNGILSMKDIAGYQQENPKRDDESIQLKDEPIGLLSEKVHYTVYNENENDESIKIKFEDLKDLLDARSFEKLKVSELFEDKKSFSLIADPQRAKDIDGMLLQLAEYNNDQLKSAILELNTEILTPEVCYSLLAFCPQIEEIEAWKQCNYPIDQMDKGSQYLITVMDIPRMYIRLDMMIFKSGFQQKMYKELNNIQIIQKACEFLKSSVGLKTVLKACLDVANNINPGTKIQKLKPSLLDNFLKLRLHENNGDTMLAYLLQKISEQKPELLQDFTNENHNTLQEAIDINFKDSLKELEDIQNQVNHLNLQLEISDKLLPRDTPFINVFKPFYEKAKLEIEVGIETGNSVERLFIETAVYLGEDKENLSEKTSAEFIGVFKQLCDEIINFKKATIESRGIEKVNQIEDV